MGEQLIYDVGLYDGNDSAYYLHLGFRVVAFEANPDLAQAAARRFDAEIAAGRMLIVNVGISRERGQTPFWICDDHLEWSSFHREIACREGSAHHAVVIPTVPFCELLDEHGMPTYCKIDIEGNDYVCLEGMRRGNTPSFISLELSRAAGEEALPTLCDLGYRRFKVVDQARFCTVAPRLYRWLDAPSPVGPLTRRANRVLRSRRGHDGWRFSIGSSGRIGPATPGRWLDADAARELLRWVGARSRRTGLSEWFDLHASL